MDKIKRHKIALYIRVSTEEQAENPEGSIKNQEERLREMVRFKNMDGPFGEIVDVFIDRARSGKDTNRPELQRLLSVIRRKEISLVMVSELSRLSRSIKDFAGIWELMQACNCQFMSLRENFDTTTAAGEMVLYTVANIAQFERRQVSERVSANFQSRASRGLYNGGVVPVGYKLNPEKPGSLEIDADQAEIVKAAFKSFLQKKVLTTAARWLNENGFKPRKQTQGGGCKARLGHFTVENLFRLLTNKAYLGIRIYHVKGEIRETKANWESIIDEVTFFRVQEIIKNNRKRKPEHEKRFPFLLSGFVSCKSCGERMVGKSAHGNSGKVPYYEHCWATRKEGCLIQKCLKCSPFRVLAKKLEPAVWDKIENLLWNSKTSEAIIEAAKKVHAKRTQSSDSKRVKEKISALKGQIDVLAERLAELPKSVSAEPIYRQMERLETLKSEEETRLNQLQRESGSHEMPAALSSYQAFLAELNRLPEIQSQAVKEKILQALIHEVKIVSDGFELEYLVGRDYIERGLTSTGPRPIWQGQGPGSENFSIFRGSNRLTNGGPTKNRTWN